MAGMDKLRVWHQCADGWEADARVRQRFRKQLPWIQYPIYNKEESGGDDHAPSTRALELNAGHILLMLNCFGSEFIDVERLQNQVL